MFVQPRLSSRSQHRDRESAWHRGSSLRMGTRVVWAWLAALTVTLLQAMMTPLCAFPMAPSLSDCLTPTGWNCSGLEERGWDVFRCAPDSCQFEGKCVKIGESVTCICDFKCGMEDDAPVCGSNSQSYHNDCFLRLDSCKLQREILPASLGNCPTDSGSGSGDDDEDVSLTEGSAEEGVAQIDSASSCDICQFGAECDTDDEDVWCMCNMDCSYISFNPVCASDGRSYDNPCLVKEMSCKRQERVEVKHLGRCHDPHFPCPESYLNYCVHGDCEQRDSLALPTCSCYSGFSGPRCEERERSVVFVVPASGRVRYVLIASVIGALQITIISLVVLCVTRKCSPKDRKSPQKQNVGPYGNDSTQCTATRLI